MKQVLGVVGSPRKYGNTHLLVERIIEGAQQEGASCRTLFLDDYVIRECTGCHICWTDRECSRNDDMNGIYTLIAQSEVIVFGTPVYWYGPTALMKAFLDRFVYFNCPENRGLVRGKTAVLAVPFEENNPETASILVGMFEKSFQYLEMELAGTILVPGLTRKGEVTDMPEIMKACFDLGGRIAL